MKRLLIILGAAVFLLVILIATKPSKERCKEEFKSTLEIMTATDFVKYADQNSVKQKSSKLQNRLDIMNEEASEKFSKQHWEDNFSYKDFLIFCIVKYDGITLHKKIGFGILNSTFEL